MNMGRKTVVVLGSLVMAGLASPAVAQYSAWYVGGQVTSADYRGTNNRETGWGALFGYEFTPNYALEAGYMDFGAISASGPGIPSLSFGATAVELAGMGAFEMGDRVSMFGRLGVYQADSTFDVTFIEPVSQELVNLVERERNTGISYGMGVTATFGNSLMLRGSWQRYADISDRVEEVDALSVAILFRF